MLGHVPFTPFSCLTPVVCLDYQLLFMSELLYTPCVFPHCWLFSSLSSGFLVRWCAPLLGPAQEPPVLTQDPVAMRVKAWGLYDLLVYCTF